MNNNAIEFVLKMKDLMSSAVMRAANQSQSSFGRMSQFANQATSRNQVLGLSFDELQRKIRQVEGVISSSTIPSQIAEARRELNSLQRMSARHSGNTNANAGATGGGVGIGGIAVGSMLGGLATAGVAAIGSGIGKMVQGAMDKESNINGMSTFIGKKEAKSTYANIEKDAEATPFDTASLLMVNRSLISAGLNAKSARTDSMNLANAIVAVGGSNDTLTRMAANMQQIKTVGKATAMDVRQFGIAGINIYAMLAKATGKSVDEVKNMDVSYELLSKAMAMARGEGGMYYNALENAQNSMQGKSSNFTEKFTNMLAKVGTAFRPLIVGVLEFGTKLLSVGKYLIRFANWVNGSSTSATVFLIALGVLGGAFIAYQAIMGAVAIKTAIVTGAQWLLNTAMAANPIGIVIVAIAALVAGFVVAYNRFEKFRAMVDGVWGALQQVGSNIMGMFSKIPTMIIDSFLQIPKAIKNAFMGVGDLFSAIFSGNFKAIPGILANIGGNLLKTNPITGFASKVFDEATKGVGSSYTMASEKSLTASAIAKAKALKKTAEDKKGLDTGTALATSNADAGKKAGESVVGGGPKTININVGKFFDNLQFTTLNSGESIEQMERLVLECLGRVVYNGAKSI